MTKFNTTPPKIADPANVRPLLGGRLPLTRAEVEDILTALAGGQRPEFGAVLRWGDKGLFWDTGEIVKLESTVDNAPVVTRLDVEASWGSMLVDNSNGPLQLILPPVDKVRGKKFTFKWIPGGTIGPGGASIPEVHPREDDVLIDFAPWWGLHIPLVAFVFQSDGEQWWVMT